MNPFSRIGSIGRPRSRWTPLAGLMFLLPVFAAAQTVLYTANGLVSVTGGPPVYNGKYVLKQSDFGFFWLDTETLSPGHVQAESKCGGFQPPSDSELYVIGDCNGITNISSSGNLVLVRQFSGQCGATIRGCNGPRDDGHSRFTFRLGTFEYLGDLGEIPDSTQTTDPQGRTWAIQPVDGTGLRFVWTATGVPNSPPVAAAFATNLSAGGRADKTNYYGDRWQLQDTSTSGPTSVTWDFNYTGFFAPDESGTEAAEGVVTGYFPCDPAGAVPGNIRSGVGCRQSLGLSNPPAGGSYQFAMKSANSFGTSANPFVSSAFAIACPQADIAGYGGFTGTCAKTGGALTLPTGGNADASASKGNLADAVFDWAFAFPSGPPAALQGLSVAVPDAAIGFSLTITFPGGYQATASGGVTLTPSLVADFSTPNPVVRGTSFLVTNLMQKAPTTILNSVDSLINPGPCGAPPVIGSNPLASSFLTAGGAAPVTAPNTAGGYCLYLKYNFTPGSSPPASQIAAHALTVTDWSPGPVINVYLDGGRTQQAPFLGSSFFLAAGTTYYLSDDEPSPPPGSVYPGAQWSLVSPSGEVALGTASTQAPLPVTFAKTCSSGCSLKLVVGAVTRQIAANISPCSPGGTTLCLNGGRFAVGVQWATPDGSSGSGQAIALTADTGYFWFFSANNVEIVLKVVDGRAANSSFWVFAGGLTDVHVVATVIDTQTGAVKIYSNPLRTPFQPIQDTSAFPASTSPEIDSSAAVSDSAGEGSESRTPSSATGPGPRIPDPGPFSTAADASACVQDATTLCLNGGRFQVQTQWRTSDGRTGSGQAVPLTGDTGYFWFFSSNNVEMVLKAVNGCGFNSSYWVFAGGLTDVNVVTTVTDTQTGAVKTYTNPQGVAFQPLQDTGAFATCP